MPDARQRRFAAAVADAFGLGPPVSDPTPVPGGRSHLMWRLSTEDGVWAVKVLNRSWEPWWLDRHRIAVRVEQTAWERGIAVPRPVHPLHPVAPLLADIVVDDVVRSVRVHEWCAGRALDGASPDIASWVGEVLATVHAPIVGLDAAGAVVFEPHDLHEWRGWLDDAPADVPAGFLAAVRAHLPDIARAKDIVDHDRVAMGDRLTPVLTHRDLKPDNILLTTGGPVLVDWDEAGADVAEWEIVRAALAFSRDGDGWRRDHFDRVLRSYRAAGGAGLAAERGCFVGVLRHQLMAAAFLLFRALGHRPVTPAERSAAYRHTHEFLTDLRASLRELPEWTRWLRAVAGD